MSEKSYPANIQPEDKLYTVYDIRNAILEFGCILRNEYGYKELTDSKIKDIFDEYMVGFFI